MASKAGQARPLKGGPAACSRDGNPSVQLYGQEETRYSRLPND